MNHLTINLTIDVPKEEIELWLFDNPNKTIQDFLNQLNNIVYLGGDCINAMTNRMLEIDIDYYIKKIDKLNQMGDLMRNADSETYTKIMSNK